MKLRVGDVIEDRRWMPSLRVVGVVRKVTCNGDFAHCVVSKFDARGELASIDMDFVFDTNQLELYRLTSAPKLEVVSAGPMASTVDKCTPRCDYEYPESSYGACDGLPCGLPATKQVGEFSACAKHERQMEEV